MATQPAKPNNNSKQGPSPVGGKPSNGQQKQQPAQSPAKK
jgi:hypothetical protein